MPVPVLGAGCARGGDRVPGAGDAGAVRVDIEASTSQISLMWVNACSLT